MRIVYRHPDNCHAERRYIVGWVCEELFGAELRCEPGDYADQLFEVEGGAEAVRIPDTFFSQSAKDWLGAKTLPSEPITRIGGVPALYRDGDRIDFIGSLFFLLSRYEEAVVRAEDRHGRFPISASVLKRENLIRRAIGNEYIELFWAALQQAHGGLARKKRGFRILPSHDIDFPSGIWLPWASWVRREARLLRTGQVRKAGSELVRRVGYGRWNGWRHDPLDTISLLMDLSERHGLRSAFNYIPVKTHRIDFGMPIDHPHVEDQWRRIAAAGHELGVHPGYKSCDQDDGVGKAADRMRRQMDKLTIHQDILGGRQHYLRWKTPSTARAWERAGLDYDGSLGFVEDCGFRCGVCYEFPLYDVVKREALNVRERPLVLMDRTLMDDDFLGLGTSERAVATVQDLKDECRRYNGDFTVLWHNDRVVNASERELYSKVLAA